MHDPARYRPTERFGDRVADYAKARPGYPSELTRWLLRETGLKAGATVVDVGSGTGLFTRNLLAADLKVYAVEPNAAMRTEAERVLSGDANFVSCNGTGEATGLAPASVDLLTVAQAFHWFDPAAARIEAQRILKPGRQAALIWNVRQLDTVFARDYEDLLMAQCPAYAAGQPHQAAPQDIAAFFDPATGTQEARLGHTQTFDFDSFRARLLSSSYTPKPDDPARVPLLAALRELYDRHQSGDCVKFGYDTVVYLGRP